MCGGFRRQGSYPVFIEQLRRAVGVLPLPSLSFYAKENLGYASKMNRLFAQLFNKRRQRQAISACSDDADIEIDLCNFIAHMVIGIEPGSKVYFEPGYGLY